MNQIIKLSLVAITLTIMLLCNCHEKPVYYKIPDELLAYVDFPVGTYWKYQDSISGDTSYVKLIDKEFYEHVDYEIETNIEYDSYTFHFSNNSVNFQCNLDLWTEDIFWYEDFFDYFVISSKSLKPFANYNEWIYNPITQLRENAIINEKIYSEILIIISQGYDKKIYWAKNIGLIRKEYYEKGEYKNGQVIQENLIKVENLIETNANSKK